MSSFAHAAKSACTRTAPRFCTTIASPPRSVLFVKKQHHSLVADALVAVIKHLRRSHPHTRLLYEQASSPFLLTTDLPNDAAEPWQPQSNDPIDLVITLGGDGTILHASSLFNTGPVPPVLSFSMGSLGFLLPFDIHDYKDALHDVFRGQAVVQERMRLSCTFHDAAGNELARCGPVGWQVMNEVTLHRGRSPHLSVVDAYVDSVHLTEAYSDGLIVSTPTGSTAYSLSSGGPIVHPLVKALLLTPICPRSLSFRPLLLPESSNITLQINPSSRAPAEVSMDGQEPPPPIRFLTPGQSVRVKASEHPIPCVRRSPSQARRSSSGCVEDSSRSDDWVRDINTLLQFNASFRKHSR